MRLRVLGCALLSALAVGTVGVQGPAVAAPSSSESLKQQVARLSAEIDRVGAQLARDAQAYERAETQLGAVTQQHFAARADRDALVAAETESRTALQGLARAAYKGGVPPMVTALMSGDPGALSQLAYVQRSVNRVGLSRHDVTRELAAQQAGAGRAVERSDALRRQALAQRQALETQRQQLAQRTTELTAALQAAGAKLIQARAAEQAAEAARQAGLRRAAQEQAARLAAQRAAQAAAAGVPYVGPASTGGGQCSAPSGYGEVNGFLSDASLCPLETVPGHRLRTDAARAFDALNRARIAATGRALCITDSYRSYPEQVDVFRRKPNLAATPGRSQHGWGLALDLGCGVQGFGSEPHRWMQLNAGQFGWVHPAWAQQGGSKPEAWHWEYVGVGR